MTGFVLAAILALGQEPSFERLSAQARQAYEANRPEEARELFGQALKLKPDWVEGWWGLGTLHYQRDRYTECRDALLEMTRLDAVAAPGWALLGLCQFRTKEYDAAFANLKRAHMLVPPGVGGQLMSVADYHLALLLTRQGAFEVSQIVLAGVAPHQKSNTEMIIGAGLACLRMAILPEELPKERRDVAYLAGKTLWALATAPPAEAEANFTALVEKYPKFPNVHYLYGAYLAAHRVEGADKEFLEELKLQPDSVPARVQLVLRHLVEQRLEEALKLAREAVALSPDSVAAQLALGRALRAQGDDQGALAAFLTAKKLDPYSPEIRLYLTTAYRALGDIEALRREQAEHARLKAEQKNWP